MTNVLITGISGFVGQYLKRHLAFNEFAVFGLDVHGSGQNKVFRGSITDRKNLLDALEKSKPDFIYHLAGILKSAELPEFYNVHVLGTAALLDAVLEVGLRPRIVIASSSAVYGAGIGKRPITESFKPRPATHYAVSKLAQEIVAMRYQTSAGLPVICVRTFNLLGPGLSPDMAPSAFAKQIAKAELVHEPKTIYTGDLSSRRDYVDVRDAVVAYSLIAEHGRAGQIYNVCSGRATSIKTCLQVLLDQAMIPVEVVLDHKRLQSHDVSIQVGDAKKLRESVGWKPIISVKESLLDLLNYWREKMKLEKET